MCTIWCGNWSTVGWQSLRYRLLLVGRSKSDPIYKGEELHIFTCTYIRTYIYTHAYSFTCVYIYTHTILSPSRRIFLPSRDQHTLSAWFRRSHWWTMKSTSRSSWLQRPTIGPPRTHLPEGEAIEGEATSRWGYVMYCTCTVLNCRYVYIYIYTAYIYICTSTHVYIVYTYI